MIKILKTFYLKNRQKSDIIFIYRNKKKISIDEFNQTYYTPFKSDPYTKDYDGDGLFDDEDPDPLNVFDNRFELVNKYDADPYALFPKNVLADYEIAYEHWYNSEYQQAKRNNDTEKMKEIEKSFMADIETSKLAEKLGLAAGSSGKNLKLFLNGNIQKNEVIDLGNSIADYYIGYSRGGRNGFYTCMNLFLNSAEQTVFPGSSLSISSKNKDYLIPGSEIIDVNDNIFKSIFQKKLPMSFDEVDILFSISCHEHSIAATNVKCFEENGETCYSANVKFYLLDLYNYTTEGWAAHLEENGLSEPYLMSACKEMKISWKKGQRFPEYDSFTDVKLRDEYTRDWQPNSSKIKGANYNFVNRKMKKFLRKF